MAWLPIPRTLWITATAILVGAFYATGYRQGLRVPFRYHDYDAMTAVLINATTLRPDLATLYSIGKSLQGEALLSMLYSLVLLGTRERKAGHCVFCTSPPKVDVR